nr:EOG090X0BAY [Leptodora kindtii]
MSAERNVLEKRKASTENLDIEPKRMKNGDDKPLLKVDNSTVSEVECLNGKGEEIRVCKISDDGDDKIKKVSTCLQAEDSLDHKQLPEVLNLKDDERLACTTPDDDKTLLAGDVSTGFHVGYFRDDPKELPVFVACNTESEGCLMTPMADNLFSAVSWLVSEKSKGADPFKTSKMTALRNSLNSWASSKGILIQGLDKERKKRVVAKTFYGCGIVVPYNRKTNPPRKARLSRTKSTQFKIFLGRPSSLSARKILHKIVESKNDTERDKNFDPLQQLVTNVQYANDELDWGMGLELGLDLLAFGGQVLHTTIIHLLGVAYELLERPEFTTILKVTPIFK